MNSANIVASGEMWAGP